MTSCPRCHCFSLKSCCGPNQCCMCDLKDLEG